MLFKDENSNPREEQPDELQMILVDKVKMEINKNQKVLAEQIVWVDQIAEKIADQFS